MDNYEAKTCKSFPDDVSKKDALVDQICDSMLQRLLQDATHLWSKSKKSSPVIELKKNVEKELAVKRLESEPERAGLSSPRSGGHSIQDLMHTTFDLGSDTSEGKILFFL